MNVILQNTAQQAATQSCKMQQRTWLSRQNAERS